MRKPDIDINDIEASNDIMRNTKPQTMDDIQSANSEKTNRVNELLNKMSVSSVENSGNKLSNFVPLPNKPESGGGGQRAFGATDLLPKTPPQMKQPPIQNQWNYNPNDEQTAKLSNYHKIYNGEPMLKPYYASMGISSSSPSSSSFSSDDKLMEKLNYMIRLLEEQQAEKTENVTEEVVLYMFFGFFVIYVLDSFTRAGKYVR